jgi:hypothetical protein
VPVWPTTPAISRADEVRTRLSGLGQSPEVDELDNYWLSWCREADLLWRRDTT